MRRRSGVTAPAAAVLIGTAAGPAGGDAAYADGKRTASPSPRRWAGARTDPGRRRQSCRADLSPCTTPSPVRCCGMTTEPCCNATVRAGAGIRMPCSR